MQTSKLVGGVTLVALLASDLGFGVVSALGQSMGNGHVPVPSLTDGALGSAPPGAAAPYQQQLLPQQAPQRQFSPAPANLCQPGAGRSYRRCPCRGAAHRRCPRGRLLLGLRLARRR
jgi:hypothetical protein